MKGFLRSASLLLAGALAGFLGVSYYFNIPINLNPITVINTGDGDVDIKNDVNQGGLPNPAPSPVAPPAPAATPEATPRIAENKPTNNAPPADPELEEMEGKQPEETAPAPATIHRRSPSPSVTYPPVFEEQPRPRPVYTSFPQPSSQRACPPVVLVRRDAPPVYYQEDLEPLPRPARTGGSYSSSHSSSTVTVNGRVVSSSSVTIVNGRVVSRSRYPTPPVDDDDQ